MSSKKRSNAVAGGSAGGAGAPEGHVVGVDGEVDSLGQPGDHPLQVAVLEGGHLAAAIADQVVVMVAVGVHGLVAGHALAGVHASCESQPLEQLQGAVDARLAHVLAPGGEMIGNPPGGDAAAKVGQRTHHGAPGGAAAVAVTHQRVVGVLDPVGGRRGHPPRMTGARRGRARAGAAAPARTPGAHPAALYRSATFAQFTVFHQASR